MQEQLLFIVLLIAWVKDGGGGGGVEGRGGEGRSSSVGGNFLRVPPSLISRIY